MTAIFGQFGDAPSSFLVAAAARDVVAIRSSMALEPVGAASDHATADLISTTGIGGSSELSYLRRFRSAGAVISRLCVRDQSYNGGRHQRDPTGRGKSPQAVS